VVKVPVFEQKILVADELAILKRIRAPVPESEDRSMSKISSDQDQNRVRVQQEESGQAKLEDAVISVFPDAAEAEVAPAPTSPAVGAAQPNLHREHWETRATAFHEAGHAVVALYFGYLFHEVSILPSAEHDSYGHVTHAPPLLYDCRNAREQKTLARQMILSAYAGLPSQRLVQPAAPDFYGDADDDNALSLSCDYHVFPRRRSVGFIGDGMHVAYLGRLKREARRLVSMLRTPIEKLAEALLDRTTLTGKEADEMVRPLLPPIL